MELVTFTRKVYEYIAYRIYGKSLDFRLVNGPQAVKAAQLFADTMIKRYGAAAGPGFVWFYIIYQFDRFKLVHFQPDAAHASFITPTMIFGKMAMDKFGDRRTIDELTIQTPWLQQYKLSQQEFVRLHGYTFTTTMTKVDDKKVEAEMMKYMDPIKEVTSKTNAGMDLCIDLTDLYNNQDVSCQVCPYRLDCKQLLKQVNPRLYKLRNYE